MMLGFAAMPVRLDHVGIYVEDLDKALAFYCGSLGMERPAIEEKPEAVLVIDDVTSLFSNLQAAQILMAAVGGDP